jgi:hypothetical protein
MAANLTSTASATSGARRLERVTIDPGRRGDGPCSAQPSRAGGIAEPRLRRNYRAVKHEASGRTGGRCWPGVGVPRRPARSRAHTGIIAEVSCCRRRLRVGSWIGGGLKSVGTQPLMSNSETRAKTLITSAFPGRP